MNEKKSSDQLADSPMKTQKKYRKRKANWLFILLLLLFEPNLEAQINIGLNIGPSVTRINWLKAEFTDINGMPTGLETVYSQSVGVLANLEATYKLDKWSFGLSTTYNNMLTKKVMPNNIEINPQNIQIYTLNPLIQYHLKEHIIISAEGGVLITPKLCLCFW